MYMGVPLPPTSGYLKWILFCNVLHQPSKTAIRVGLTMPSSPHEFLKAFLQEVRICVPFLSPRGHVPFGTVLKKKQILLKRVEYIEKN